MKSDDFYMKGLGDNTIKGRIDSSFIDGGVNHQESSTQLQTKYQCIMKCEGSKTYHKPGFCPDCSVKLISVVRNKHQF